MSCSSKGLSSSKTTLRAMLPSQSVSRTIGRKTKRTTRLLEEKEITSTRKHCTSLGCSKTQSISTQSIPTAMTRKFRETVCTSSSAVIGNWHHHQRQSTLRPTVSRNWYHTLRPAMSRTPANGITECWMTGRQKSI
ncbi:unnamed protein product [Amoebophrya sp. A120]|nr:unnamed protein product [Amoebophrya sp. A120]|eukprot:GSA120T00015950001.1